MEEREILLKAFEIMVNRKGTGVQICKGIECKECPFQYWNTCMLEADICEECEE